MFHTVLGFFQMAWFVLKFTKSDPPTLFHSMFGFLQFQVACFEITTEGKETSVSVIFVPVFFRQFGFLSIVRVFLQGTVLPEDVAFYRIFILLQHGVIIEKATFHH